MFRYYEKSIIEEELEVLRGGHTNNWERTKKDIKEARYRLSIKPDHSVPFNSRPLINGHPQRSTAHDFPLEELQEVNTP